MAALYSFYWRWRLRTWYVLNAPRVYRNWWKLFTAKVSHSPTILQLRSGVQYVVRPTSGDLGVINEAVILDSYLGSGYVSCQPNSIVVDVGANIGDFSVQAARLCKTGRVYAIEPVRENCLCITRHIALNELTNIELFPIALGGYNGEVSIHLNGSMSSVEWGSGELRTVQQLTLREFMRIANIKVIDLLKLDCEGAEWEILPAAESVLSAVRQICMEYHNGKLNVSWLENWLTAQGFTVARTQSPWNGMLWAWRI